VSDVSGLIDAYIPRPDAAERHAIDVAAPPDAVLAALWHTDLAGPLARAMLALRVLPAALRGSATARRRLRGLRTRPVTLRDVVADGFAVLGEVPNGVVLGLTGRFWALSGGTVRTDPATWAAGPPAGMAQAAWSFAVVPHGDGGTRLVTETRVRCADAAARRAFRRYWLVVRPGSGLLRRLILRRIRDAAEAR